MKELERMVLWILARAINGPAVLMPYRIRTLYVELIANLIHLPFTVFGRVAKILLTQLRIEDPTPNGAQPEVSGEEPLYDIPSKTSVETRYAVLFSGGTDSTCAASLVAKGHSHIHLLTFFERATKNSPIPNRNIELLRAKFCSTQIVSKVFSVDPLVRYFSYEHYIKNILKHRWLILATPGFSSLSWHVRALTYCLENGITHVVDGLTRELMHFPGHMDNVIELFRAFYQEFGITYENPVRNWPTPPDQQFIDKVIVNRHGTDFIWGDRHVAQNKTTGYYLFREGILPKSYVKGSGLDFLMQHDCYPFGLYNIMVFWGFLSYLPYDLYCKKVSSLMQDKITVARQLVTTHLKSPSDSRLKRLLEGPIDE